MHDLVRQHGTTVRAAIVAVLDGLDVAHLLRSAGVSDATITTLRRRLVG